MNIATICARGGSKGVKNKNLLRLNGKPLIQYTFECVEKSNLIDHFIFSTDSKEIFDISKELTRNSSKRLLDSYFRPESLAQDNTPKIETIKHILEKFEMEYNVRPNIIADLDVGCPLRLPEDIDQAVSKLISNDEYDCITTVYPSERNPYFNMVEFDKGGNISLVKKPENIITSRQMAPKVFSVTPAAMIWRRDRLHIRHLYDGNWAIHEIPIERGIDIDTNFDLNLVKFLIDQK